MCLAYFLFDNSSVTLSIHFVITRLCLNKSCGVAVKLEQSVKQTGPSYCSLRVVCLLGGGGLAAWRVQLGRLNVLTVWVVSFLSHSLDQFHWLENWQKQVLWMNMSYSRGSELLGEWVRLCVCRRGGGKFLAHVLVISSGVWKTLYICFLIFEPPPPRSSLALLFL